MSNKVRWAVRGAAAAMLACSLGGCGWTARDEYLRNQQVMVGSHPGDGSRVASDWKASRGRYVQSPEMAARFDEER